MAAGEMNDFLKKFFRTMHAKAMPQPVLARLVDDKKKGLLTENQQEWFDKYLEEDTSRDPSPTGYKAKDLPKPSEESELTEPELRKLYEAFALAIAGMKGDSANYSSTKDREASKFIKRWMEEKKLFEIPKATDECKEAIDDIVKLLTTSEHANTLKNYILRNATKGGAENKELFSQMEDVDKFIAKCASGKYNSDTTVQDKLKRVALTLKELVPIYSIDVDPIKQAVSGYRDQLDTIASSDAFSKIEEPKATTLQEFKDRYASELLTTLYENKNVRERFAQHDTKKIVEKIDKAEGYLSWDNSKSDDYVNPKYEDTLTPFASFKKWAGDKYDDTLKKYEELRGGHLFKSPQAKELCKAIDKENISPADGLPAVLEKEQKIRDRISNTTVREHFDWFMEVMKDVKKQTPRALEGAWSDASQMKTVIEQIILKATGPKADESDMAKAKTAMEIMTVMKYGVLTSKVMNAMKTTEFSMFSDGKLSWNKNEGIQFITKAFDKSIKAAFMGVGFGVVILRNKIHMRNIEFTNENNKSGALVDRFRQEKQNVESARDGDLADLDAEIADARTGKQTNEDILRTLTGKDTEADQNREKESWQTDLDRIKAGPIYQRREAAQHAKDTHQAEIDKQKARKQRKQSQHEAYDKATSIVNGEAKAEEIRAIEDEKTAIRNLVNQVNARLTAVPLVDDAGNPIVDPDAQRAYKEGLGQQLAAYSQQIIDADGRIAALDTKYNADYINNARNQQAALRAENDVYLDAEARERAAQAQYDAAQADYEAADHELLTTTNYRDLNDKIEEFNNASALVREMDGVIRDREYAKEHYDEEHYNRVLELEDYWNFLQSGNTRTMGWSLNKAQKNFDVNNPALWAQFRSENGLDS